MKERTVYINQLGNVEIEAEERRLSDNLDSWKEFYEDEFSIPCPYDNIATIVDKLEANTP